MDLSSSNSCRGHGVGVSIGQAAKFAGMRNYPEIGAGSLEQVPLASPALLAATSPLLDADRMAQRPPSRGRVAWLNAAPVCASVDKVVAIASKSPPRAP
jgi:hypothetical protein